MTTNVHRPFGVGFLSLLIIIGGVLDIVAAVVLLFQRDNEDLLDAVDVSKGDIATYAIVAIVLGVVVVAVGAALRRGENWSRLLVGLIALVRLGTVVWLVAAYHHIHWYNAVWPTVLYALVAGYLFLDDDAKAYFERT